MKPWITLLLKELKEQRIFLWVSLGLLGIYTIIGALVAPQDGLLVFGAGAIIIFHVLLMGIILLTSFLKEWRTGSSHFWLTFPQSGFSLVMSKFAASFIYTAFTLLLSIGILALMYILDAQPSFKQYPEFRILVEPIIGLIFQKTWFFFYTLNLYLAASLASIFLFIAVCSKAVRRFGWLLGIVTVMVGIYLLGLFMDTPVYSAVTEWGEVVNVEKVVTEIGEEVEEKWKSVDTSEQELISNKLNNNEWMNVGEDAESEGSIYLGGILFDALILLASFYVSGFILDRRVGV